MDKNIQTIAGCENGESSVSVTGKKKKVFLIGDSIRQGYAPHVSEYLGDAYEVVSPKENCRNTQYVITCLRTWANMFEDRQDVVAVTFNCGHWDVAHWNCDQEPLTQPTEYANNIRRIIRQLRSFFPCAALLFVTTSPMAPGDNSGHFNPRTNEEIQAYNALALAVCREAGVATLDIYTAMAPWGKECYADYAHPTTQCNKLLGEEIATAILDLFK